MSGGAWKTRKSNRILPCGVSRAPRRAMCADTRSRSQVTRLSRKVLASSPETLTTPRSARWTDGICPAPLLSNRSVTYARSAAASRDEIVMPQTFDLILKGGIVVNHDGRVERDIGVRAGRIAAIGDLSQASAEREIECRGLHILPGVIDSQVHFREPGLDHKEDLESGSRAAVMGGVTAVFEMPNTDPQTTTPEALADKVRRGVNRMHCDFAFWVGGTHENASHVPELERLPGAAGIKVFVGSSTGSLLVEDDAGVTEILKRTRRRAAFHAE